MSKDNKIINDMEKILNEYTTDIENARKQGLLNKNTASINLSRLEKFIGWCKGESASINKDKQ